MKVKLSGKELKPLRDKFPTVCTSCKDGSKEKNLTNFPHDKKTGRLGAVCRQCVAKKQLEQKLRRYGVSGDWYQQAMIKQGGMCAICGRTDPGTGTRLCVDHDHATGKVRGLLCSFCNAGLGHFMDSPSSLDNASAYLRRHGK